jgi:hypothetical protein
LRGLVDAHAHVQATHEDAAAKVPEDARRNRDVHVKNVRALGRKFYPSERI